MHAGLEPRAETSRGSSRSARPASPAPPARWERAVLPLAWLLSAAWLLVWLPRGWVPHDEGTLAHAAERVLAGELPHRNFLDVYTGGLSYLNALAFRLFGTDLLAPRWMLLAFALAWIPAVFWIARRFAGPAAAGGITLLAVAWSLPNYFAALPSWYTLFFATWGLAALLRWLHTGRARWLFAAGLCGGASVLFKITGLYFVAGALLAVAFAEGERPRAEEEGRTAGGWIYRAFVTAAVLAFLLVLARLLGADEGGRKLYHLALAPAAAALALLGSEWRRPLAPGGPRFAFLLRSGTPLLAGVAVPLALFAGAFAAAGALDDLLRGVFVLPAARLSHAATVPPLAWPSLRAVALPAALALFVPRGAKYPPRIVVFAALCCAAALAAVPSEPETYRAVFRSLRAALPFAVAAGALLLALRGRTTEGGPPRAAVYAVLAVAGTCALVQYPFSAPVYFTYVAPLGILAIAAVVALRGGVPRPVGAIGIAFYLLFAVLWVNPGFIFQMGMRFAADRQTARLELPRGGIRVTAADAADYRALAQALARRARGGYVYAGPDAPEVYFLAGLRNPTPDLFEFFDSEAGRPERLIPLLEARGVRAVALNRTPDFSGPLPPALLAELRARYPHTESIGDFEVRWR